MFKSDFHFDLPAGLIAQEPLKKRTDSRLLCLNSEGIQDSFFNTLTSRLRKGDLLVFNNTKVIPARVYGQKVTGGKLELLLERLISDREGLFQIRSSKPLKEGGEFFLSGSKAKCTVLGRQGEFFRIAIDGEILTVLNDIGHIPLPPYIDRRGDQQDRERYQTVFAHHPGAVAAPTAGLHFDEALISQIKEKGIDVSYITLHVGSGTFKPVRVENLDEHVMHAEWIDVSEELVAAVKDAKRVIAVGTTVVRALESASSSGTLIPFCGETNIFIQPGYGFKCVDALVTNFHLPESTLLALVCAFGGYQEVMDAYRHAVAEHYRFFSYGDAMFLSRKSS